MCITLLKLILLHFWCLCTTDLFQTELSTCQNVFGLIMTASQYCNVSPGVSSQTSTKLNQLLQEISQGFSTVTVALRKQRDAAAKALEEEHERYKRCSQDADLYKKSMENLRKTCNELEIKLTHVEDREKLLKDHKNTLETQIGVVQRQLDNLSSDALRFQAHHNKIIETYKEQDEKHFQTVSVSSIGNDLHFIYAS
jgi:chromosome segregation ATPase